MILADSMAQSQKEEDEFRERNMSKMGNYDNPEEGCPACKRFRVMLGGDGKHRCEKCCFCIEENNTDHDFLSFMR